MARTFDEINEAKARAKAVDLPRLAQELGFTLIPAGRGYKCKEMDSLNFYMKNDQWRWKRFSQDIGGDAISFVQNFTSCTNFMDALNYLVGDDMVYTTVKTTNEPKATPPKKKFEPPMENDNTHRAYAYLVKTRGINSQVVNSLIKSGHIAQEKAHGNIIFKIKDENGKYIGAEIVGTCTGSRFKQISEGLKEGYGFEVCRGDGHKAIFFESAIDMMSCMQTGGFYNCRMISMGGLKHTIVKETMKRYNILPEDVYICSDNDEKGNLFADKLKEEFPSINRAIPPEGKDWNDYIRSDKYRQICEEKIRIRNDIDSSIDEALSFLKAFDIFSTNQTFIQKIKEGNSYRKEDIQYACLEEISELLFENNLCDTAIRAEGETDFRIEDVSQKRLFMGSYKQVLDKLKEHIEPQMVRGTTKKNVEINHS